MTKYPELVYKDGHLFWKSKNAPRKVLDRPIGCKDKDGYLTFGMDKQTKKVSRVIWEMHHGEIPSNMVIDHADGNKTNNRIENLRLATRQQNNMNRKNVGDTSKYKGVSRHSQSGKWQARIQVGGIVNFIGLFCSEEEAAEAYNKHAKDLFGDFAVTNTII